MDGSFAVRFRVPRSWMLSTVGLESVGERARSRARLRRWARGVWRGALASGGCRVRRFVLLVAVGGVQGSAVTWVETLKPIIDAATDVGVWPDDDPAHRVCTCYMRDGSVPMGVPTVSIMVVPLAWGVDAPMWLAGLAPDGTRGLLRGLLVPDGEWVTSNMRLDPGVKARRLERVALRSRPIWEGVRLGSSCGVLCGVSYPDSRMEWKGDPDNVAETATAVWAAGALLGCVPADPVLFGFCLLPGTSPPRMHGLTLLMFDPPSVVDWPARFVSSVGNDA